MKKKEWKARALNAEVTVSGLPTFNDKHHLEFKGTTGFDTTGDNTGSAIITAITHIVVCS